MSHAITPLKVAAAIIESCGKFLIGRRKKGSRFEGKWEFPGGKIEDNESPEQCLQRELYEEFGIEARVLGQYHANTYNYPDGAIELLTYNVRHMFGAYTPVDHDAIAWVSPAEMEKYDFVEPDREVVGKLSGKNSFNFEL